MTCKTECLPDIRTPTSEQCVVSDTASLEINVPMRRCLRKTCSPEVLPVVGKLTVQDFVIIVEGQKQELGHVPLVSNGCVRSKLRAGSDRTFGAQPDVPVTDEDKAAAKLEAPGTHAGGEGGGGGGTQPSGEGAILERRLVALENLFFR